MADRAQIEQRCRDAIEEMQRKIQAKVEQADSVQART